MDGLGRLCRTHANRTCMNRSTPPTHRIPSPRPCRATWLAALTAIILSTACSEPVDPYRRAPDEGLVSYSVTADEVLRRCAAAYGRAHTLTATGVLSAYHKTSPRVVPVAWMLDRPGRCKLQIGDDAVIVLGRDWWSYRGGEGRFTRHRQFTRTPIQTAVLLMTDGLPMLVDELFVEGEDALKPSGLLGRPGWRIEGAAWAGGRPCYVLTRPEGVGKSQRELSLWIDQDSFLLRAWKLSGVDGQRLIAGCDYHELSADSTLPAGAFSLEAPAPLALPEPAQPQRP